MVSGLVGSAVALGIRSIIVRKFGTESNGVYEAAWAMSGMFGTFIINAMGMDFYPRLTATIQDSKETTRLVNEQTQVGVLLALPGLLATLAFAPWVIRLFYSVKFLPSAELLPWFVLTVFVRMMTFPMTYILLAKGASRRYAAILIAFHVVHILCIVGLVPVFGLLAVAVINPILSVVYLFGLCALAGPLVSFRWSTDARKLIGISCAWILAGFTCGQFLPLVWKEAAGGCLTAGALIFSVRGCASRLGKKHRLVQLAYKFPGGRKIVGR
jgi:PST family polysaccharide transporter